VRRTCITQNGGSEYGEKSIKCWVPGAQCLGASLVAIGVNHRVSTKH
jgi:hypothetical protein